MMESRLSREDDLLDNIKKIRNKETIENQAKEFHNIAIMLISRIVELKKEASNYKDKLNKKKTALKELKDAHFKLKESYNSIIKIKDKFEKTKLNAVVFVYLRVRSVDIRML